MRRTGVRFDVRVQMVVLRLIRPLVGMVFSLRDERRVHAPVLALLNCSVRILGHVPVDNFFAAFIGPFNRVNGSWSDMIPPWFKTDLGYQHSLSGARSASMPLRIPPGEWPCSFATAYSVAPTSIKSV